MRLNGPRLNGPGCGVASALPCSDGDAPKYSVHLGINMYASPDPFGPSDNLNADLHFGADSMEEALGEIGKAITFFRSER